MSANEMPSTTTPPRALHRSGRAAAIAIGGVAAAFLLAACGSGGSSATAGTTASTPAPSSATSPTAGSSSGDSMAGMPTITIKDFKYSGPASVAAGSMVMVTNHDSVAHTLTADKGSAFSVTVQPGKTGSFTAPSKAGSYSYHCNYHANMHGTLKVS